MSNCDKSCKAYFQNPLIRENFMTESQNKISEKPKVQNHQKALKPVLFKTKSGKEQPFVLLKLKENTRNEHTQDKYRINLYKCRCAKLMEKLPTPKPKYNPCQKNQERSAHEKKVLCTSQLMEKLPTPKTKYNPCQNDQERSAHERKVLCTSPLMEKLPTPKPKYNPCQHDQERSAHERKVLCISQ
jgi:hypothetical protein